MCLYGFLHLDLLFTFFLIKEFGLYTMEFLCLFMNFPLLPGSLLAHFCLMVKAPTKSLLVKLNVFILRHGGSLSGNSLQMQLLGDSGMLQQSVAGSPRAPRY